MDYEALKRLMEKQLFYSRIAAFAALAAVAALGICLAIVMPSVMQTVTKAVSP